MRSFRLPIKIIFIFCFSFSGCQKENAKCCSCLESEGKSDVYDYPLKPGMPEWANLSPAGMYEVCQIPMDMLTKMCPIGLVDSWLTYPLRSNVFAWANPQEGFKNMTGNFNGLTELLARPKTEELLYKKYVQFDPSGYGSNASGLDKGRYATDLFILELTLAQFELLSQLSGQKKKDLISEAIHKRSQKYKDNTYEPLSHTSDAYIMSHVMMQEQYKPFLDELGDQAMASFIETGRYSYPLDSPRPEENLSKIITHAQNFLVK
jgi:hypothetical protein